MLLENVLERDSVLFSATEGGGHSAHAHTGCPEKVYGFRRS